MQAELVKAQRIQGETKIKGKDILGHVVGGVGQNMIFAFWSSYMMMFYTDIFGLSAAFVGALFLVSRLWDAVNDPMMGMLADRTRTRWGRFRPWLLFMAVPVAICLVLNFTVPNVTGVAAMAYAGVTYLLMSMVFTAVDIPYWSLPAAMTTDPRERTKIYSFSKMSGNLVSAVVGMVTIPLVQVLGGGDLKKGFFFVAIIIGIVGAVFYILGFLCIRENVEASTEKFDIKKAIRAIGQNKPLFIVMITTLAVNMGLILKMSLNVYYAQYNLGNLSLVSILSMISIPGIIVGSLLAPKVAGYFGKKKAIVVCNITLLVLGIIFYFVGYGNFTIILALSAIQMLIIGCQTVILTSMNADTIEYAEWKTGQRNEGVISSAQTFVTKFGMGITGAVCAVILEMSGYVPNVEQAQHTLSTFHFVIALLPGVIGLLACIPMYFYDLTEEKHAQIVKEIKERKTNSEC